MMYPGTGRIIHMGWVVGLSSIQKEDNHKRKDESRGEIIKTLKGEDNNLGIFSECFLFGLGLLSSVCTSLSVF